VSEAAPPEDPPPTAAWPARPARVIPPTVFERPERANSPTLTQAFAPLGPLFALDVLTAFTVGMLPPLLPLVADQWALTAVEAGLVNTLYAIGRLTGSYPASQLRVRWGTRRVVFIGLSGLILGSVGCGLAPTFPLFLLARVVMGLGASATFLAVFAELLESAPAPWRGRLANAFEGVAILSLAVGGSLAAVVAQAAGWRPVFVGAGLVMLLCYVFGRRIGATAGRRQAPVETARPSVSAGAFRGLAPVYAGTLSLGLTWAGLFATVVPLLGHDRYALTTTAIGLGMAAAYVAEVAGLALLSLVIDRVRREPLFLAGAVVVLGGGLLLAAGTRPIVFAAGLVLVGSGFSVWMIPATVLADRAGTPLPPIHLAAYRIALDAGMILGPLILGAMAELAGYRAAVGAGGFIFVAGAAVLARLRPRRIFR
jgi:MFS family permease